MSSGTVAAPLPPPPPPPLSSSAAVSSAATSVSVLTPSLTLPLPPASLTKTVAPKLPIRKKAVVSVPAVPVSAATATPATPTKSDIDVTKKAPRAAPKKSTRPTKSTLLLAPPPPPPPPPRPPPPPSLFAPLAAVATVATLSADDPRDADVDREPESTQDVAVEKAAVAAATASSAGKRVASKNVEKKAAATGRAATAAAGRKGGDVAADGKRGSDATAQLATHAKDGAVEEEKGEREEEEEQDETFDLSDPRVAQLWQAADSLSTRSEASLLYVTALMSTPPSASSSSSSTTGKRPSSRKKSSGDADSDTVGAGDPSLCAALLGMTDLSAELRKSRLEQTTAIARVMRRKTKKDEAAAGTDTGVTLGSVSAPPPLSSSPSSAAPSPSPSATSSNATHSAAAATPSSGSNTAPTFPTVLTPTLASSSTAPAPLAPSSLSLTFQPPSASRTRSSSSSSSKKGADNGKRATSKKQKPSAKSKKTAATAPVTASVTSTRVLRSRREIAREARLVEQREALCRLAHVTHRETLEYNVAPCFGCRVCLHPEVRASDALAAAPWCIFPPFFTVVARAHPWRGASVNAFAGTARLAVQPDPAVRASTAPKLAPVPLDGLARRVPGRHSYAQLVKLLTKPAKPTKEAKKKSRKSLSSSSSSSSSSDPVAVVPVFATAVAKKSSSKSRKKSEADGAEKSEKETKRASSKKKKSEAEGDDASGEKRKPKSAKSKVGADTKGKRKKKERETVTVDDAEGGSGGGGSGDDLQMSSEATGDSEDGSGAKKPKVRVSVLQTLMALAATEPVTVHDVDGEEEEEGGGGGGSGGSGGTDAVSYEYPYYIRKGVNRGLPVAVAGSTLRFQALGFYGVTPAVDSADENKTASESDDGLIFSWLDRLEARGAKIARPLLIDAPDIVASLGNWKQDAPLDDRTLGDEVQRLLSASGIATSLDDDDDDDRVARCDETVDGGDGTAKIAASKKRTRSPATRGGSTKTSAAGDDGDGGTDGKAARKKPKIAAAAAAARKTAIGKKTESDGKEEKRADDGGEQRKQEAALDLKLKTVVDVVRQYVNDPTRGLEYTRAPEVTLVFLEFEDKAQPKGWVALGRAAIDAIVRNWPPLTPTSYAANGVGYVAQAIQSADSIAFALPGADAATYRVFQYNMSSGVARQIRRVDAPPSTTVSTSLERDGLGPVAHVLGLPPVAQRRAYESFRNLRPVESVSLLQLFADAYRYESSVLGVALAPSVYSLAPVVSPSLSSSATFSSSSSSSSTLSSPPPPQSTSPPGGPALAPVLSTSTSSSASFSSSSSSSSSSTPSVAPTPTTLADPAKTVAPPTTSVADRLRRRALQNLENLDVSERKTWIATLLGGGGDGSGEATLFSSATADSATSKSTGSPFSSSRSSPASSPRAVKSATSSSGGGVGTTTAKAPTLLSLPPPPPTSFAVMMRASEMLPQRRRIDVDSPNLLYAALARFVTHAFVSGLQITTGGVSRPWATHTVVVERIEALIDAASEMRYRRQVATTRAAHDDRKLPWQIDERLAFHGTPFASADAIVRGGFRGMYNSQSSYGLGTYFSTDASYSDEYAKPCPTTGRQTMFVARLLVNGAKPTSHGDLMPGWHVNRHGGGGGAVAGPGAWLRAVPERGLGEFPCVVGCDTWPDTKIFVISENDSIVPQFLITYRRVPR